MAWRIVAINNPAQLSTKDNRLVVRQDEEVGLPLEDIDALVIDSYGVTMTTHLMTALSSSKITTIICDDKHLPATVCLPYQQHSRQARISQLHVTMSEPLKKQLWRAVVRQKITNQACVLEACGAEGYDQLHRYASSVKSGDVDNREALAARLYFSILLDDITRRKPIWHNAALDYGYALVRSHIARHIAARGLVSSYGIFHHNQLNSFNLADDLIEPYRPYVDMFVLTTLSVRRVGDADARLTQDDRKALLDILNKNVIINNKKYPLRHAVDMTVESFVGCLEDGSSDALILPKIIL